MAGRQEKNKIPVKQTPRQVKPPVAEAMSVKIPKWAPFGVLFFTLLVYSRGFTNGFTGFDDDFYIINNPFLRDFSLHGVYSIFTTFYSGNYHPLTTTVHLFQYNLFGLNATAYHTTNILLHLVNTWLVYRLAVRLSGNNITGLVVSLFFGIHPMHVESVAWISELKDMLYALFYLLALLAWLRYLDSGLAKKYYLQALFLFVLSLLSKSAAITLPVLLIAIEMYKGRKITAASLVEKVPMLALSVFFGILAILSQRAGGAFNGLMISYGAVNTFFLFFSGIAFYLVKLLLPTGLFIMHNFPILQTQGILPPMYYASFPFVLIIAWLVGRRSPWRREALFGMAFFMITLSVMLQVISVGSALTSERYTYVSYIGLFYIAGQWIAKVGLPRYRQVTLIILSIFILVFAALSWDRIGVWKDDSTLFNDLVEKNPDFYYGYWLRGNTEKKAGALRDALNDYTKTIELNPGFEDSYYNRGKIYDELNNPKAAILDYSRSIAINATQADAFNNRGWDYFITGDPKSALTDFNKALAIKPDYADALNNRGWLQVSKGANREAMADYTRAITIRPDFDRPLYNRADLKFKTGDFNGAIQDYATLLKMHPNDNQLWYYTGMAYQSLKNMPAACENWKKASTLGNLKAAEMINKFCK